jgi:preprotein translocase subunit SecE
MESQYQKWVTVSYLAVSVLLGYIVFALAFKIVGMYDLEARVRNAELLIRGVSVVAAGILFAALYFNDTANQFMNEVIVELVRVTWPTSKETYSATLIVMVMVLVSGLVLGLLDQFWTLLMKWVL